MRAESEQLGWFALYRATGSRFPGELKVFGLRRFATVALAGSTVAVFWRRFARTRNQDLRFSP